MLKISTPGQIASGVRCISEATYLGFNILSLYETLFRISPLSLIFEECSGLS